MKKHCVIVGGSHVAAQLAPNLRQQGWDGPITVVSDEYHLPYHRPPLSKDFISGDKTIEEILIRQPAVYERAQVRFLLGVHVSGIYRDNRSVTFGDGETLAYDKLVLAVGARVRKLDIEGADLDGVFYLRDVNDVQRIRARLRKAKNAVIVGGGYIGLETAASLRRQGLNVTVLEAMGRILQRVTAPEVSAFYARVHREEGVDIATDTQVARMLGDKAVEAVECADGRRIPADIVIVGVGVIPNTELAAAAGLAVENGIVVDEYARTGDPDILAAGDCTAHINPIYGRSVRLESVQNANDQAMTAVLTLCGKEKPYAVLPWFWSDQYDLKLQIAGLNQGYTDVVVRGNPASGRSFSAFYLQRGRVVAVDAINRPMDFMAGKKLIAAGVDIDAALLRDETRDLKTAFA